jgi:hypothetical protein
VTAPKKDALAALLEHCDELWSATPINIAREQAKTRRLVRALRKADIEAGVRAGINHLMPYSSVDVAEQQVAALVAAVLSRPTRRKGA